MSAPDAPASAAARTRPSALLARGTGIPPARRGVLVVLAVGAFMTSFDAAIVGLSLPAMAKAFDTHVGGSIEWVTIAYLVAVSALLLTVGRLGDLVSRSPLWLSGLAVFAIGSTLCGLAPTLDLLIAARTLQGVGGALILAAGYAILANTFPADERGIAFGIVAVAMAISAAAGPILGGFINDHLDWRLIFAINIPISVAAIVAGRRVLPRHPPLSRPAFDYAGAVLFGAGLAGVTTVLWFGGVWGWASVRFAAAAATVGVVMCGAILVDRRSPEPLINTSIFRGRRFSPALARIGLSSMALIVPGFILPFYLLRLRDFPALTAGIVLAPFPIAAMMLSPVAGALVDHIHPRWLEVSGLAVIAVGLLFLSRLGASSPMPEIMALLALVGIGQGIFTAPNSKAIMDAAPESEEGEASGLMQTAMTVGQSVSVTVASAVFAGLGSGAAGGLLAHDGSRLTGAQRDSAQATFLSGYQMTLFVGAAFAVLGGLTVLFQLRAPAPVGGPQPSHRLPGILTFRR